MNTTLHLSLTGAGDAFQDGNHRQETARILRHLVETIESGVEGRFVLRDINGNWVGSATFEREAE